MVAVRGALTDSGGITLDRVGLAGRLGPLSSCIAQGERVALLGANGVGKSTLLRLIAGLGGSPGRLETARPLGMMAQDYRSSLLPWLTVLDNITLPMVRLPQIEKRRRLDELLTALPLGDKLARYPVALSGGEAQLVALARALIYRPRTLLLDEPFAALDLATRLPLRRWLRERVAETRCTMILASHDLDDVSALTERALLLGGVPARIVYDGPVERSVLEARCRT